MSNQKFFYAVVKIESYGKTRIEYHINYSSSGSQKDIKKAREIVEELQAFSKSIPFYEQEYKEFNKKYNKKDNPLDSLINLKAEIKFYCEQVYGIKNCEQVEVPLGKIDNKEVIANIW
jgi:hypothetical protein